MTPGFPLALRLGIGLALVLLCPRCSQAPPPNIVLIVLDTTRSDHLSAYGYARPTSPGLESFAQDAIRFERAYSTSSWTLASHASLFTGLLPATHQATQENLLLDSEIDTLAELLERRGYETVAFSNNAWISGATQLSQGFDQVQALWRERKPSSEDPANHATNLAVEDWLDGRDEERPFFLFVNLMDPHWPYAAPAPFRDRYREPAEILRPLQRANLPAIVWYLHPGWPEAVLRARSALYDAEITYVDAVLEELLDRLGSATDLDRTLVIVTADHGENLGERGHQGHSFSLYDSTLRIPLLLRPPGGTGRPLVRSDPVQLTDVFATIAEAAGISALDPRVFGRNLLAEPLPEERPIVAEYYYPKTFLERFPKTENARKALKKFERRLRSIQVGTEKLIWGSDGKHELYELGSDPGETRNLFELRPERAAELEEQLDQIIHERAREATEPRGSVADMDEETLSRLRALGYVP